MTTLKSVGPFVVVLGCAQDGGVPHLGCTCHLCEFARDDYSQGHLAPCVAFVTGQGRCFLIDATPDLTRQASLLRKIYLDHQQSQLGFSGVFLTHAHVGHYLGLAYLGKEIAHTHHFPLYGTELMGQFLKETKPYQYLFTRKEACWNVMGENVVIKIDDLKITSFFVPHRNEDADTVAYFIEGPHKKLIYLPDHDVYTDKTIKWLKKADEILIDGSFYSPKELNRRSFKNIPHPPIVESMDVLTGLEEKVIFTHFNHTNPVLLDGPERKHVLNKGFRLADEQMKIFL